MELFLRLKKKWFYLIQCGEKKEEYREITPYWETRIRKTNFTHVHFTLGYPKKTDLSRHMIKEIKEIVISKGRPEWGAEPSKEYFVIRFK